MTSDILLIIGCLLVPLVLHRMWLVVLASLFLSLLASAFGWHEGLKEDVPPVMLIFGYAVTAGFVVVVAIVIFNIKGWCIQRWRKPSNPAT